MFSFFLPLNERVCKRINIITLCEKFYIIKMPSKEQLCSLLLKSSSATETSNNNDNSVVVQSDSFLAQDVEVLVCEIKENLRLSSSGCKYRPTTASQRRLSRNTPYGLPCKCSTDKCTCRKKRIFSSTSTSSEDPYERLQELLRDGSLIKEAVRRLNIGLSPKQRYFYESDDETNITQQKCAS